MNYANQQVSSKRSILGIPDSSEGAASLKQKTSTDPSSPVPQRFQNLLGIRSKVREGDQRQYTQSGFKSRPEASERQPNKSTVEPTRGHVVATPHNQKARQVPRPPETISQNARPIEQRELGSRKFTGVNDKPQTKELIHEGQNSTGQQEFSIKDHDEDHESTDQITTNDALSLGLNEQYAIEQPIKVQSMFMATYELQPDQVRDVANAMTQQKPLNESSHALALLTGNLAHVPPNTVTKLVSQNPFINQGLQSIDFSQILDQPLSIKQIFDALEFDDQTMKLAVATGIDLNGMTTPREFLKLGGIDPGLLTVEMGLLKSNLLLDGLSGYVARAKSFYKPAQDQVSAFGVQTSIGKSNKGVNPVQQQHELDPSKTTYIQSYAAPLSTNSTKGEMVYDQESVIDPQSIGGTMQFDSNDLVYDTRQAAQLSYAPSPIQAQDLSREAFYEVDAASARTINKQWDQEARNLISGVVEDERLQKDLARVLSNGHELLPVDSKLSTMTPRIIADNTLAFQDPFESLKSDPSVEVFRTSYYPEKSKVEPLSILSLGTTGLLGDEAIQQRSVHAAPNTQASQLSANLMSSPAPNPVFGQFREPIHQPQLSRSELGMFEMAPAVAGQANMIIKQSELSSLMENADTGETINLESRDLAIASPKEQSRVLSFNFEFGKNQEGSEGSPNSSRDGFEQANSVTNDRTGVNESRANSKSVFALESNNPTPRVDRSELVQQILDKSSMLLKSGGGSMRVSIETGDLGHLDLAVDVNDKNLDLKIMASSEKLRETLVVELPRIRDMLQNQNLNLTNVEVGVNSRQSGGQLSQFANSQQGGQNPRYRDEQNLTTPSYSRQEARSVFSRRHSPSNHVGSIQVFA